MTNELQIGRQKHPAPHRAGRPVGSSRGERYSDRKLVTEVEALRAGPWRIPIGAPPRRYLLGDSFVHIERSRHRGCMWRCPGCHRRTRTLYAVPEGWLCNLCGQLDYPIQRVSANMRQLVARARGSRTLADGEEAIRFLRRQRLMEEAERCMERLEDRRTRGR